MKNITLSSIYTFESGYKEILEFLLKNLNSTYNIIPRTYSGIPKEYVNYFYNVPYFIDINTLDFNILSINNDLSLNNPLLHLKYDRPKLLYTMWESTRINDLLIEILSKFKCIIVPNEYNKTNFLKQGLSTDIEVVHLFCDTDVYKYNKPDDSRNKFVFGISNEDPRKNLDRVIRCFAKAFTKDIKNVELQVKTCSGNLQRICDNRITFINKKIPKEDLRDWYYNLDVYVSGATCEGWGMMQQESMCCGRPIIFTNYGGLKEFANKDNSFEVGYDEVYSTGYWGDYGGKWSEFKEDEMIEMMRYCYNNRGEVIKKGILASQQASVFTKERFLKKIDEVITKYI